VPVHDDVARLPDERQQPGLGLQRPDLLCGGFPCQDVSVAGRRAGLNGERSGLFHEYARIAATLRPRWLLLENVPGLLSSQSGRDFGVMLATLAQLGYGLAWRTLDSRYFGVPQRRRRVFIIGARADRDPRAAAERAGQVLAVGTRCPGHPPQGRAAGPDTAVASLSGLGTGGPDDNDAQGRYGKGTDSDATDTFVAFHATQDPIHGPVSPALGANASIGVSTPVGVRRLTPTECERLQALPDGWTQLGGTPDSRRYAAFGDAVTVTVAHWIGERLLQAAARDRWGGQTPAGKSPPPGPEPRPFEASEKLTRLLREARYRRR
jgi:DNA (cytosine-5)-methyltransferase 1